jgi:DNA-directed RNA polymerase subunit RPC12/RpoP
MSKAVEMNFKCQECGSELNLDLMIPNKLWNEINPEGFMILCASCIMKRIERLHPKYVYNLTLHWKPEFKE